MTDTKEHQVLIKRLTLIKEYFEKRNRSNWSRQGLANFVGLNLSTLSVYKRQEDNPLGDKIRWAYKKIEKSKSAQSKNYRDYLIEAKKREPGNYLKVKV